jgi:hypothetical protein
MPFRGDTAILLRGDVMPKLSAKERRHEVRCIDRHSGFYQCDGCGQVWSPNLGAGGRLPRGWWRCPNGCNALRTKDAGPQSATNS